jgi:hypothetical protein
MLTSIALLAISAAPQATLPVPDDVALPTFRQLISTLPTGTDRVLCLSVDGADPSATLLSALSTSALRAVGASGCQTIRQPDRKYIVVAPGGEPGQYIYLRHFTLSSPTRASEPPREFRRLVGVSQAASASSLDC